MTDRPLTVAVVGAGHRSEVYVEHALHHPDEMKVVAVADPIRARRDRLAEMHGVPPSMRFESHEDIVRRPGLADAVVNGTLDQQHHATTLPLLAAGYHMLLEKPIACSLAEVKDLIDAAQRHQRIVMICHVLRYAPFYQRVKALLKQGRLGRILSMRTSECVSFHHMATAFVRGKWNRRLQTTPIIVAKCCHDLDLIAWFMSGVAPLRIASFGRQAYFRPEMAPPEAGTRCVVDCPLVDSCAYSARHLFITQRRWPFYAWGSTGGEGMSDAQKEQSLAGDNPQGVCVWKTGCDQYDHQSVIIDFDGGATVTHDLFCATARSTRTIHIVGTEGELVGDCDEGIMHVRRPDPKIWPGFHQETIDVKVSDGGNGAGHGGGDLRLVADFVAVLRGSATSSGVTRIEDSYIGHQLAFEADRAAREGRIIDLNP